MSKYRVVIQLNSDDAKIKKGTLGQIRNMQKTGEEIEIELVVHGGAGDLLLKDGEYENVIADLHAHGVHFVICRNTLNSKGWTEKNFPSWVRIVDSAVMHLIQRQHEGWAYLRN